MKGVELTQGESVTNGATLSSFVLFALLCLKPFNATRVNIICKL